MQYPHILLPRTHFKRIEEDLSEHYLCRTTPTRNFLNAAGLIKDEELFRDELDFLDYSTNHLGQFQIDFNFLSLCGDNKRYFRSYWNFSDSVNCPEYLRDFEVDNSKGVFFFKIGEIHRKIQFPLIKNSKGKNDTFTAIVKHTPTNSNFWHFSIAWIDATGNEVNPKGSSTWKYPLIASIRASLLNKFLTDHPNPTLVEERYFHKS